MNTPATVLGVRLSKTRWAAAPAEYRDAVVAWFEGSAGDSGTPRWSNRSQGISQARKRKKRHR